MAYKINQTHMNKEDFERRLKEIIEQHCQPIRIDDGAGTRVYHVRVEAKFQIVQPAEKAYNWCPDPPSIIAEVQIFNDGLIDNIPVKKWGADDNLVDCTLDEARRILAMENAMIPTSQLGKETSETLRNI